MEANDPRGGAIFDPRGRIYVKLRITMLHTKYRSFGSCGLREDFYLFPIISLWKIMTPRGVAYMDPRGTVGSIYKEDHYIVTHKT